MSAPGAFPADAPGISPTPPNDPSLTGPGTATALNAPRPARHARAPRCVTILIELADTVLRQTCRSIVIQTCRQHLIRPAKTTEKPRPGAELLKPLRQLIESVNDTLKGQLDLERHGGRTQSGVTARVLQRILALTAAIWHNCHTHQPHLRSLIAYDH